MTNKKPIPLHRKLFYKMFDSAFSREISFIFILSVILLIICVNIDAFEKLVDFVEYYEYYELDEIVMLVLISSISFMVIIIRNVKHLNVEIKLRIKSENKLNKLAFFDPLTGLPNRALFKNKLEQFVSRDKESMQLGAVLYIDLDDFKNINDSMGHAWGDELLKKFSERLQIQLRTYDTLFRISGDEFTVIIGSPINIHGISTLAEKLIESLKAPFILDREEVYTSMSVGVAVFPTDAQTAKGLLKCADTAMYSAKHEGKGHYRYYSIDLDKQAKLKLKISNKLRRAIELEEFTLNYQPIIDIETQEVKGAEALLRWNNKELGCVGPDIFIPIAEEIGLINEIGNWVLRQACWQNKQWHLAGYSYLMMSVNMSSKQLVNDDFINVVNNALVKSQLEGSYLELELTETALLGNLEIAIEQIYRLKKMGVCIALDDFGTGYSSMSYLVKLKIDRLKIDKSFIDNIPHSEDDRITTHAIISLANNLNLQVTAEGIETEEQYKYVKSTSCNAAQGYYFSHPLTADNFKFLLDKSPTFS
ncbi:putative bifunctional diguanylate cyclase/phosphodiesterase [Shewanella violacea]|nr:EAL domain-containing protein [Shewanella violacea]